MNVENIQEPVPKSIVVTDVPELARVELFIRGPIGPVIEYSGELIKLQDLSSKYNVLYVTINTPGGDLMVTLELLRIFKLYQKIVTIGIGEVASAGFILWSAGTLKVLDEYAILMIHRESFGNFGKIAEHLALANVSETIYRRLYANTVDSLLTEDERTRSRISEVWIDALDMVKRGQCITINDFTNPTRRVVDTITTYVLLNEKGEEEYLTLEPNSGVYVFIEAPGTDVDDMYTPYMDKIGMYINDLDDYVYGLERPKPFNFNET